KIDQFESNVFLVNTGWTGGPYGVGQRMKLSYTRAMIHAALEGELNTVETKQEEIFGLHMPIHISGVPNEVLFPHDTWEDKGEDDKTAEELAQKFHDNFKKFSHATEDIKYAGPQFNHT